MSKEQWKVGALIKPPKGQKWIENMIHTNSKINEHIIGKPTGGRCKGCQIGAGTSRSRVTRTTYVGQDTKFPNGKHAIRVLEVRKKELPELVHIHEHRTLDGEFCTGCAELVSQGKLEIRNGKAWYWNPDYLRFVRDTA